MGSSLGMTTTAEGVETLEQLEKLRAEGCTEAQGYYYSAAVRATEVSALLATIGPAPDTAAQNQSAAHTISLDGVRAMQLEPGRGPATLAG